MPTPARAHCRARPARRAAAVRVAAPALVLAALAPVGASGPAVGAAPPASAAPAADGPARAGRAVRVVAPPRVEVHVPAGRFTMGVDEDTASAAVAQCELVFAPMLVGMRRAARVSFCEDYSDQLAAMAPREVYLDAFAIDRLEVTVARYRACVVAGACKLDPLVAGDSRLIRDEWPVVNVTWDEAQDFCRWRGGRLPTEAEWERAARGTDAAATWPWGELEQPHDFNHGQPRAHAMRQIERQPSDVPLAFFGDPDDSDGALLIAVPGSYPWGESPSGTRDQAGNVAEWTADAWHQDDATRGYFGLTDVNPERQAWTFVPRVVRGGSWRQPTFIAKSSLRDPFNAIYEPSRRFTHVGFRCARSAR